MTGDLATVPSSVLLGLFGKDGTTVQLCWEDALSVRLDDAFAELDAVRAEMKAVRQKLRRVSKLDRFKGELLSLHHAGASAKELAFWLRTRKQVKAHRTTVIRRLLQWQQEVAD